MIATWMMYWTVIGMLLLGAAHLVEQLLLGRGGSTRRVWAVALVVAVTLPALVVVVREGEAVPTGAGLDSIPAPGMLVLAAGIDLLSALDDVLMRAWAVASAALALLLGGSLLAVARHRRSWSAEEVDGVPVLVSDDVGPAVVGILRSWIVLPRWAVAEDAVRRALLIKHEQEHLEAGDSRLILLSALLVVAMPWNAALWRLAMRLRTAVETDCDRRVIECPGVDARSYGALLLSVGRRRSRRAVAAAIGFSRPRSMLATRIDRMTLQRRQGGVRTLAMALAAVALLATAWSLPQPMRAGSAVELTPCPQNTPAARVPRTMRSG